MKYTRRHAAGRASQAGITLMEVIISLSILAMVTVGLNQLTDRWADDTQDTLTASQVRTFGEAVQSYIKDNYAAVQAVATATAPAIIDVPTLVAAQKLPAGYQNSNAYGQATCALVLEPTANRLQAMVITEGGKTLGDPSLGTIAATTGGSGGGVYATDTANIKGAVGGWILATTTYDNLTNNLGKRCNGAAGNVRVTVGHPMMALWFENGDVSSAWLARDAVPGRPELNAMNTPLVLNSAQSTGGACTTAGAIAQDGSGELLSCQGGIWKPEVKCMQTYADLNNLQTDGRCYNGVNLPNAPTPDWVFIEVYRHVNGTNFYVSQRVVGMTGSSAGRVWTRNQQSNTQAGGWTSWLQVEDPNVHFWAGSVYADSSLGAPYINASDHIDATNYVWTNGNLYANQNVIVTNNVQGGYLYSSGSIQSNADITNLNGTVKNVGPSWAFLGYGAGWNANATPQDAQGSAWVNDVYVRSIGKWISQAASPPVQYVYANATYYGSVTLTNNYGKNLMVYAWGESNCGGIAGINASVGGTSVTQSARGGVTLFVPPWASYSLSSYDGTCGGTTTLYMSAATF